MTPTPPSSQSRVAAGPGETNFFEQYHLKITLPISESKFIAILDRLKLSYDKCGERGTGMAIPPPMWSNAVDMSKVQTCYQIYGGEDSVHRVGKLYRAYVDQNHQVIYVENAFAYTGP